MRFNTEMLDAPTEVTITWDWATAKEEVCLTNSLTSGIHPVRWPDAVDCTTAATLINNTTSGFVLNGEEVATKKYIDEKIQFMLDYVKATLNETLNATSNPEAQKPKANYYPSEPRSKMNVGVGKISPSISLLANIEKTHPTAFD